MNGIGFQLARPARNSGGKIPRTEEKALASGYAENQGALLIVDGDGNFAAAAADAALIAAVANTAGGADTSGFVMLARKEFPSGYMQGIGIKGQDFMSSYVGSLPAVTGGQYGFIRDSDGVYKVDFNETINIVLTYLGGIDKSPADAAGSGQDTLVLSRFLDSVVQEM